MRSPPNSVLSTWRAALAACACVSGACASSHAGEPSRDAAGSREDLDAGVEARSFHFGITSGSAAALSGLCSFALLDLDAGGCSGDDAYVACATSMCGLESCITGACTDYNDCLVNSADPCNADCMLPPGCTCPPTVESCALTHCLTVLTCGTNDGGPCAALDRCCEAQPTADAMSVCRQLSGVSKVRGDVACQQVLDIRIDSGVPFVSCADLGDF